MNACVVYKSKYGSTKEYANLIGEKLSIEVFDSEKVSEKILENFDTIIFGGAFYKSKLNISGYILKNFKMLVDKKIIVYTVGIFDPKDKENIVGMRDAFFRTFPKDVVNSMTIFNFRGALDYRKLKLLDKISIIIISNMIKNKPKDIISENEKVILQILEEPANYINMSTIESLVTFMEKK